ncbi:MAG TPA: glycosyltransferase family 4 protein [Chitinispirillaceae bacterium]|nr:glycosyltransferase family 4 protein [Chitinispirillaceae bacterium]
MHIAIVNSEYPSPSGCDQGGIATYSYTIANILAQIGHKVEILLREGTVPENLHDQVTIHYYKFQPVRKTPSILSLLKKDITDWELGHSQYIFDLLSKIHQQNIIDIAEFPDYGGLAAARKSSCPFPVIINFHTPSELVDRINQTEFTRSRKALHSFERKAIYNSNGFRCPSISLRYDICKLYNLKLSDIRIIRNPVSIDHFNSINKKQKKNRFDILFAGRLERRKGAEMLINAIHLLLQINSSIYLTIAGNSEPGGEHHYRDALEMSLSREERSRVYFSGPLTRKNLSILYCRSSLFLFPSIFENAPYSLFEAITARLPVLASACSGIKEIIKHKENGLLFKPGNVDDLCEQVNFALSNYQRCCCMADNAYEELKQINNPQKIATDSLQFYQQVITGFIH